MVVVESAPSSEMDIDVLKMKKEYPKNKIELGHLTQHNLKQFRLVNLSVFPVAYSEKFYSDVLKNSKMCRLAYFNDIVVGAVSYRIENVTLKQTDPGSEQSVKKCYIMTLGCLAAYRRYGVGTMMLKHVIKHCQKHGSIKSIYLHVHVGNQDAVNFYQNFGFHITGEVNDYYRRIYPQTAYILEKCLSDVEPVESDSESE